MEFRKIAGRVYNIPRGSYAHIVWEKKLPTRKGVELDIVKRTKVNARLGVSYDNMKVVQLKREDGTLPVVNAGLPWGKWLDYPYFIQHNDNKYLRLALDKNNRMRSEYFINGQPATKAMVEGYCLKSAFRGGDNIPDTLTINIDNIISI